ARQELGFMTRETAAFDQVIDIGAVPRQSLRQVVAALRADGTRRRQARADFRPLAQRLDTRAHHSDRFMQAAYFGESALELRMKLLGTALIVAAPSNERQREHPERTDQQHRSRRDQHDLERRTRKNFEHDLLL